MSQLSEEAPLATSNAPFSDPHRTLDGSRRAFVDFDGLDTLWVNTGTLCNIQCANCYIESSPTNDALVYLRRDELAPYLAEAKAMAAREIAFTGGEPFMNPDMALMAEDALEAGFSVLVLTNAMRPAMRPKVQEAMLALQSRFADRLALRISLDHHSKDQHDQERGKGSFDIAVEGVKWYAAKGFTLSVAGRSLWAETPEVAHAGYQRLFDEIGLNLQANNPAHLVMFPEMDEQAPTPEITEACWDILNVAPSSMMCANTRMLVKRKGAAAPVLLACTLIPYDAAFEMGETLQEASGPVRLNHPHCSKFCVLGGASCSG